MEEKFFRSVRIRAMLNFGVFCALSWILMLIADILKMDEVNFLFFENISGVFFIIILFFESVAGIIFIVVMIIGFFIFRTIQKNTNSKVCTNFVEFWVINLLGLAIAVFLNLININEKIVDFIFIIFTFVACYKYILVYLQLQKLSNEKLFYVCAFLFALSEIFICAELFNNIFALGASAMLVVCSIIEFFAWYRTKQLKSI